MPTERLVKWSKEAQEFFEKAEDNSVSLDLVISFGCASQTGEGFEELVNTINSESIKRKVKKVIITDTSYLYRHTIEQFSGYCNPNIPTEWYLKNKNVIEKLKVDTELKSWVTGIGSEEFEKWYKQIKEDFLSDVVFQESVIQMVTNVFSKAIYLCEGQRDLGNIINFILEETAYTCANFKSVNIVYPMGLVGPVKVAIDKYKLNIRHLSYDISWHAGKDKALVLDRNKVNNEIITFITEKATNINFFVIDRQGNFIYKNNSVNKVVSEDNAKRLDSKTWENSVQVIKDNKELICEEGDKGKNFLSIKYPLVINGNVEGVIGLAVDITDRKKAEELANKLKVQEELYNIAREVTHDICSPLSALEVVRALSLDKLGKKEREMFELSTRRIKEIINKLIEKYKGSKNGEYIEKEQSCKNEENYIMPSSIKDIVESMRYRYQGKEIKFNFNEGENNKFEFIRGNFVDFSRMMTNVIKNAVEAIEEGKAGEIEVRYEVKGEEVEIRVKDNGKGMPKEMVEKLMTGDVVGTTKREGHGIGMQQIMGTIKAMEGKLKIESKENVGTEFIIRFQKIEKPIWFKDKIEVKKGDTVVILDDELLMHNIWKEKLKKYEEEIEVKYFTKGLEALNFLKTKEGKEKVFLIADYKLRNQEMTGINVIEKSGMKDRHILVTNLYLSDIKDFDEKKEYLKTCHKMYLNDISISLVN